TAVEGVLEHCAEAAAESDGAFLAEAGSYLRALIPLLEVQSLDDLNALAARWRPELAEGRHYHSRQRLAVFKPLLEAVRHYWRKKYEDLEVEPMRRLAYEDFDRFRTGW